ncbi:MAG: NfeD family protein, partial [Planctomycetales bacterium]|nr:NfeD family protein [Planctomycetales bacterium]
TYFGRIPLLSNLMLNPPSAQDNNVDNLTVTTEERTQVAVGDTGVTDSPLRPAGRVRFGESLVDVTSEADFVDAGQTVRVVKIRGTNVIVRVV